MIRQNSYMFVLTAICACMFQIYSEITTGIAKRRSNFDNKLQENRMLWQLKVCATPLCVGECTRDEACASVFFNKITGQCQGHSITFGEPLVASDMQNYRYYVRPHGEKYIGDSCSANEDCLTENSNCFLAVCQCLPGYSFSPRTHECKVCTNYGSEYWEIRDHFISKKNVKVFENMSLQQCLENCTSRTDFTCVSLEYGRTSQQCFLSNITVLDFPERWYDDPIQEFDISYYQRDCE